MAEHDETHVGQDPCTLVPEEFLPAKFAQQIRQAGIRAHHDDAAFVEKRQRITKATPLAVLRLCRAACCQHRPHMRFVDGRLGLREGQPDQGIEEIVPIAGTRRNLPPLKNAGFILLPKRSLAFLLGDETNRHPLGIRDRALRTVHQRVELCPGRPRAPGVAERLQRGDQRREAGRLKPRRRIPIMHVFQPRQRENTPPQPRDGRSGPARKGPVRAARRTRGSSLASLKRASVPRRLVNPYHSNGCSTLIEWHIGLDTGSRLSECRWGLLGSPAVSSGTGFSCQRHAAGSIGRSRRGCRWRRVCYSALHVRSLRRPAVAGEYVPLFVKP